MNKKFGEYGHCESEMKDGYMKLKADSTVYPHEQELQEELENYLSLGKTSLDVTLESLKQSEKEIVNEIEELLSKWRMNAKKILMVDIAKQYNEACKDVKNRKTTNNEWTIDEYGNVEISNQTYRMNIRIYERTKWDSDLKESVPYEWRVSYSLYTNTINNEQGCLVRIDDKKFSNKESAEKYIAGRKKAYTKYFTEEFPPVPKEYASLFKCNGKLIEGYKIEDGE